MNHTVIFWIKARNGKYDMRTKTLLAISLLMISTQGLAACRMATPSNLNESRVEVHEGNFYDEQPIARVTDSYLSGLAAHYERYGDGPVYISIAYDPKSRNATAIITHFNYGIRED